MEGKKATDAIARLGKRQSEEDFLKAVNELQGIVRQGKERAMKKAGVSVQDIQEKPSSSQSIDDLVKMYGGK
jgi:hypothetical protein